jgi:protein tyrosine phosphatase (PTP) superfamily phosphohydrolase (DUF442 family)
MRLSRKIGLAALLVLLPLLAAGGVYAKWELLDYRLVTISPGAVFQSAAIPAAELPAVLRRHGIRSVIDLRDVDLDLVALEHDAVTAAGATHLHVPMTLEPTAEDCRRFLDAMAHADKPALVHCKHGQGRSVAMCAIYRIENEGWSNAAAFDGTARLPDSLRFLTVMWPGLRRFDAEENKGRAVLEYRPTHPPRARGA